MNSLSMSADPRHSDVNVRHEWMALRHGDAVDENLKLDFDYVPGVPATQFDGGKLIRFALACYQPYRKTQSSAL